MHLPAKNHLVKLEVKKKINSYIYKKKAINSNFRIK